MNRPFVPQPQAFVHRAGSALDFFVCGDDRAAAMQLLERRVREILVAEGAAAFAVPKIDAAIHEAGHCAGAHHEKLTVKRAVIFKAPISCAAAAMVGEAWAGRTTYGGKKWRIDPGTDPVEDLRYARVTIAGLAAEVVFGVARSGSSLDEVIAAQAMTATAAAKFGVGAEELWDKVWRQALEICHRDRRVIGAVAERLLHYGSVTGGALRDLLDEVQTAPGRRS